MPDLKKSHRDDFHYFLAIPIRWGDMDALGHVNNTTYIRFFEEARVAFLAQTKVNRYWTVEAGPLLAHINCNYYQPITHDNEIEVATRVVKLGNSSMTLQQAVFLKGENTLVAEGGSVVVWADFKKAVSIPLPDQIRELLSAGQQADQA